MPTTEPKVKRAVACAFPISPTIENKRGINGTDWISTLYVQNCDK